MANFDIAFEATMGHEGGYVDDPDDRGGETYKGISRENHPLWAGWPVIDGFKTLYDYPNDNGIFRKMLSDDAAIKDSVKRFYRHDFWDAIKGDKYSRQAISNEMFDTAVNMSANYAIKFLQRALNMLNSMGHLYDDVYVDGRLGPMTFSALNSYLKVRSEELLLKFLNGLQMARYIEIIEGREKNEKYARGWIEKRINIEQVS